MSVEDDQERRKDCPVRPHKHHKEETHLTKGGRNCTKGRVRKGLRNAMLSLAIPSTLQGNYRPRSEATTSLVGQDTDQHLHATFSDTLWDHELGPYRNLVAPPEPGTQFNIAKPTLKEVEETVRVASSASSPSGFPYNLQTLLTAPQTSLDDPEGDLVERESRCAVEVC